MNNYFEPGQEIETTIVQISGDTIFLDLNAKTEGGVKEGKEVVVKLIQKYHVDIIAIGISIGNEMNSIMFAI